MISKLYPALMTLLLASALPAAMPQGDYPYTQTLELLPGSNTTARFGSFVINEELFNALNPQDSNLRLVDSAGTETPFLLRTRKGQRSLSQERIIPFEKISFTKLPENQIEIVMQNSDPRHFTTPLHSILLATDIKNFEKHVSLYRSDDQQSWQLITDRQPIFDYSRYIDIRSNRISFPPTAARYFKIVIANITEQQASPFTHLTRETRAGQEFSAVESSSFTRTDFRINDIALHEKITEIIRDRALTQPCSVSDFAISTGERRSRITFTTPRTPVTEITLLTETPYYFRRFTLETSADTKSWQPVHSGIFSSVNADSAPREQKTIALPRPVRAAHYRLTIENNDSPPLDISGVELLAETREIIFYCTQTESYRVIYGAAEARTPVYDIGQVLAQTRSETTALYKAGPQLPNPGYGQAMSRRSLISRRTLMTIAVILMIAVLAWLIAKTARSIGTE